MKKLLIFVLLAGAVGTSLGMKKDENNFAFESKVTNKRKFSKIARAKYLKSLQAEDDRRQAEIRTLDDYELEVEEITPAWKKPKVEPNKATEISRSFDGYEELSVFLIKETSRLKQNENNPDRAITFNPFIKVREITPRPNRKK